MNGLKFKKLGTIGFLLELQIAKDSLEHMANYRNLIMRLFQSVLLIFLINTLAAKPPEWDWVKAVYEPSRLYSYDVAVESFTGEAVIVGSWQLDLNTFWGDNYRPSTDFSVTHGATDGFVARYDTLGNMIWAFKIGGPSMDEVRSVTIDPNPLNQPESVCHSANTG